MRRAKINNNGMTFMEVAYCTAKLHSEFYEEDRLMSGEEYYEYCAITEVQIAKAVFRRNSYQEY